MPLRRALVEGVERGLRLGDLVFADEPLDLGKGRALALRGALFAALGHDLVIRRIDAVQHLGGLVARLAL